MNDIMLNAYQDHTFAQSIDDLPLFAEVIDDWRAVRAAETQALAGVITSTIARERCISRKQLWELIVVEHFMQYREAEFRKVIQLLVHKGTVQCAVPSRNGPLNDHAMLRLTQRRAPSSSTGEPPARLSS
jgi:hypothetical protein